MSYKMRTKVVVTAGLCAALSLTGASVALAESIPVAQTGDATESNSNAVTVTNQSDLRSALEDSSVTSIVLGDDITFNEEWFPIVVKAGRTLVIDGAGHAISGMRVNKGVLKPSGSGIPGDGGSCDYYCGFIGDSRGNLTIKNLMFSDAEVDINPLDVNDKSTGSSVIAVAVANNGGKLVMENVSVENSVVRGYTKVGILHGFTQGGRAEFTKCSISDTTTVLEADGTDPEACFAGTIAGYNGNDSIKTNGIRLSNAKLEVADSVDWGVESQTKDDGTVFVVNAYNNYYGLTTPTYTTDGYGMNTVAMVASVDGYQYETLADAIAAAEDGVETKVSLLKDVVESVTIPAEKNIAFDLAGHKITSNNGHTITNNGTLSIGDSSAEKSGIVDCVTKSKAALFNGPTGVVEEISAGTFERSAETDTAGIYGSYYLIENQGKINKISGGDFHSGDGAVEHLGAIGSLIRNGGGEPIKAEIGSITGGTYRNAANIIKNEPGSKIGSISGGTFTMDNTVNHWQGGNNVILNYGEIDKMVGGQFKALGSGVYNVEDEAANYWRTGLYNAGKIGEISGSFSMVMEGDNNRGIALTAESTTIIKGGTFTAKDTISEPARASILFNVNEKAIFDVMGGTFSSTPEKYVADGYVVSGSNGAFTVSVYAPPVTPPTPSDKTEVEKNPDGSTTTTVTKPDGSQTITHETATGTESVVKKDEDGNVTSTEVAVSEKDAESGKVELPLADAEPATDVDKAQAVEVKVPASVSDKAPVQVTVPVAKDDSEPDYGIVVFAVDADGNETVIPKCSVDKDGNVVFEATGDVTIKVVDNAKDMPDVTDSDWFAGDVVDFATARGIVNGVERPDGSRVFDGYGKTSRGMFVAMLHNLELNPEAASEGSLADVPENAFYADAAAWALEEGILSGVDMPDGTKEFQGESAVTREQVAVFLMRYAEHLGMDVSKRAEIDFPDAGEVSSYAEDAVSWAVAEGLFTGDDVTGELNPTDGAARAEVATVLMRFINLMYA